MVLNMLVNGVWICNHSSVTVETQCHYFGTAYLMSNPGEEWLIELVGMYACAHRLYKLHYLLMSILLTIKVFSDVTPCCLVDSISVSEESTTFVLRSEDFSETLVSIYQTASSHIPEDRTLNFIALRTSNLVFYTLPLNGF
jgi:hypothetical protein